MRYGIGYFTLEGSTGACGCNVGGELTSGIGSKPLFAAAHGNDVTGLPVHLKSVDIHFRNRCAGDKTCGGITGNGGFFYGSCLIA